MKELKKNYSFSICILIAVGIAFLYPQYFIEYKGFKFSGLIIPLLQIIMLGMGMTMSIEDFMGIIKTPKAVLVGLFCQFLIMPFWGYMLTLFFDFPAEIAAGILLIGCSPSGLASNVMSLIAKANVALSITITTFATLLAPILTPLLMKLLGGQYIEIEFWNMFNDIINIIILPIGVGFLFNRYFSSFSQKLLKILPLVSMIGIALILMVIVAAGQASLKTVGITLLLVVVLHNLGGYFFGYNLAKFLGMKTQECRTIALEVGLQNGGLASGLANQMGKLATVGLAPALFGPIMNITGSLLAGWWGRKKD
jgi:bile acid:Na+ symporter, BASS family